MGQLTMHRGSVETDRRHEEYGLELDPDLRAEHTQSCVW